MKRAKRFNEGNSVGLDVIDDETGALSTSKRNPETGELYNPSGNVTSRESKSVSKTDSAPKTTSASTPASTPAPVKKDTETSSVKKLTKEQGEKIAAKSKAAESSAPASASTPKGSTYRDFKGKIQKTTENGPSAADTIGKGISSIGRGLSSAASSVGDYFKNFETPAEVRSRMNKEEKAKDKADRASKNMASGGMASASRRGDGIAQRGKTRGKMC